MELQIGIGGAVVSSCVSIGPYTFLRERGANRLARLKVVWLKRERNGPPKRRIYATATNVIARGTNIFFFPRKLDALDSSLGGFALASENCGTLYDVVGSVKRHEELASCAARFSLHLKESFLFP